MLWLQTTLWGLWEPPVGLPQLRSPPISTYGNIGFGRPGRPVGIPTIVTRAAGAPETDVAISRDRGRTQLRQAYGGLPQTSDDGFEP